VIVAHHSSVGVGVDTTIVPSGEEASNRKGGRLPCVKNASK